MFWSKKKSGNEVKEKQLRELKNSFPSLRRPNNDDSIFEIKFVVENQYQVLKIFIPSDFPTTRPVLQVAGTLEHPWLDRFKQVSGCEKLIRWNSSSRLVEVIESALSGLSAGGSSINPPQQHVGFQQNSEITYNSFQHNQFQQQNSYQNQNQHSEPTFFPNTGNMMMNNVIIPPPGVKNSPSSTPMGVQNPAEMREDEKLSRQDSFNRTPITMPQVPSTFPSLHNLTDIQLERLLNDDVAFELHVEKMDCLESVRLLRDQLRSSNYEQTSANLVLSEKCNEKKKELADVQNKLKEEIGKYEAKRKEVSRKYEIDQNQLKTELQQKGNIFDEQSENIGRSFVNGEIDLSTFSKEYIQKRTKFHEISAKLSMLPQ